MIAADVSAAAPALHVADGAVTVPPTGDPDFASAMDGICEDRGIDAVVPAREADLLWWSRNAAQLAGGRLKVLASPMETLAFCFDKLACHDALGEIGVSSPKTCSIKDAASKLAGPVILKHRRGSGSRGVEILESPPSDAGGELEECVVQELLDGQEYSVDCYADSTGAFRCGVVRRRVGVVDGQMDLGETVYDGGLVEECRKILGARRFWGPVNIQFIRHGGGASVIDINPRFPGGIGLTVASGVNMAEYAVAELCGETPAFPEGYEEVSYFGHADGITLPGSLKANGVSR